MKWVRWTFAALTLTAVPFVALNCGTAEHPLGLGDQGSLADATVSIGPCPAEGAVRACHAVVAQHPGYVDCFSGEQTCIGGQWSPCLGGPAGGTIWTRAYTPKLQPEEGAGSLHLRSLGQVTGADGGVCALDICNPSCQGFNEQPDAAIAPTPGCVITYPEGGGGTADAPGGSSDSAVFGDGGADGGCLTTVSGTVYDPGLNAPLPNVAVYQPSGALITFPSGVQCQSCSALLSPYNYLTYSATDGTFKLAVNGTSNVQVVFQAGKWRREITVPGTLTACTDNPIKGADGGSGSDLTRLPKNASEGDIPLTAIAMATHEPAECLMLKILGGDTTEFGNSGSTKRIQLYNGTGNTFTGAVNYSSIYASQASINAYDQILLPCIGTTNPVLNATQQGYFSSYGNSGGRLFLNHKSAVYTTSNNALDHGFAPWDTQFTYNPSVTSDTKAITGANGRILNGTAPATQFQTWLAARGAYSGGSACNPANAPGTICTPDPYLMPISPIGANAFEWIRGANNNDWGANPNGNFNLSYSFDLNDAGVTPTLTADGGPGTGCGRVIVNSMHVDTARGFTNTTFPAACNSGLPMSPNEFMFEYLLFELSSCSVAEPVPPPPPPPPPPTIGPPAQPITYTNTYTMGPCPMGQVGQWDNFGYNVNTPPGTEIKFAVQTSPEGGALTWSPDGGSPAGALIADVPLDHPGGNDAGVPSCTATGPSPCGNNCAANVNASMTSACPATCNCPIDLLKPLSRFDAGLSVGNAREPVLQVNATLVPEQSCTGVLSPGLLTTTSGTNGMCVNSNMDLSGSACTTNADCNEDYHCASGNCVWSAPTSYFDPNCRDKNGYLAIDLTIGVPCATPSGWQIPICNRGSASVPAGSPIYLSDDGNGGQGAWGCPAAPQTSGGSAGCQYNLKNDLVPGACIDIDTSKPNVPGGGPPWPNGGQCAVLENGNRDIYVNWNLGANVQPLAECGTNSATAPGGSANGMGAGCKNNSTVTKTNGASCGSGGTNSCGAAAGPPTIPGLSSWTVTYTCVPAE